MIPVTRESSLTWCHLMLVNRLAQNIIHQHHLQNILYICYANCDLHDEDELLVSYCLRTISPLEMQNNNKISKVQYSFPRKEQTLIYFSSAFFPTD